MPDASINQPTEPRVERVTVHRECLACGYDLWNQVVEGVCSECGRPVRQTLAVPVWAWQEPHRAWGLARGLRFMAIGAISAAGMAILTLLSAIILFEFAQVAAAFVVVAEVWAGLVALLIYAGGLAFAAKASPRAARLGIASAVVLGLLVAIVWVLSLLIVSRSSVLATLEPQTVIPCMGALAVVQGAMMCVWLAANAGVLSSRRRRDWVVRFTRFGGVVFGGLAVNVLLAWFRLLEGREGELRLIFVLVTLWGTFLMSILWGIWAPIIWIRFAKRLKELANGRPAIEVASANEASRPVAANAGAPKDVN